MAGRMWGHTSERQEWEGQCSQWPNIPTRSNSEKFHCSALLCWGQGSCTLGHTQAIPTPQHPHCWTLRNAYALVHLHVHIFWKTMHVKGWKHTQLKKSSPINPIVFLLWDSVSSCRPSWPRTIIFLTLPCWGYRFVPLTTPEFSNRRSTWEFPSHRHVVKVARAEASVCKWMVATAQRTNSGPSSWDQGSRTCLGVHRVLGECCLGQGLWEGYRPLSTPHFIPQSKYKFLLKTDSRVRLDRRIQMLATDGVFSLANYPGYKAHGVGFSAWAYQCVVKPCL